ncbi:MAG TPA: VWA domain-containing protein [Thermoanaerobaculia bacterium]|jgi:VWFA-related protein|nr:VWA domain-containing protein [Thermoanaerobaculia bacterium]
MRRIQRTVALLFLAGALGSSVFASPARADDPKAPTAPPDPAAPPAAPAIAPTAAPAAGPTAAPTTPSAADPKTVLPPPKKKKLDRSTQKKLIAALSEEYRAWFEEVTILLSDEEKAAFLTLDKDYQRDAFIKRFWAVRDPYPETAKNEFKDRWQATIEQARASFGNLADDRSRLMLLNGPPDGRITSRCTTVLWPLEVWFYGRGNRLREEFVLVFYQRWGAGQYRLWAPGEGLDVLFIEGTSGASLERVANECRDGDQLAGGINWVARQGLGYMTLQLQIETPPKGPSGEWVATFNSYSTDVPPDAPGFPAKLDLAFPGKRQNRTVVQGVFSINPGDIGQAKLGEHRSYNLQMTGEILEGHELFDSFRYKFDFPGELPAQATLPLVFQRYLRPGRYKMVVKIEDINGGKFHRSERDLIVPQVERDEPAPPPEDAASASLLAEANAAIRRAENTLQIIPPTGELQTGMLRFDTLTTGPDITKVTFGLDGKPLLTKTKPPYSVELDLGTLPRSRQLTAVALDASGKELASDSVALNSAGQRFRVRLTEPERGKRYVKSLTANAEVQVPDGEAVERVELFLNEDRVATLYQPPYTQPIVLPKELDLGYVRAVAYLTDGNSTEDVAFVNAPDDFQQLKVQYVELYTSVLDRAGRPVEGLEQKDFSISEDGVAQEINRFERVTDLPIHAAILLDTSASMEPNIAAARSAALEFLEKRIQPKDRAAVITFNDRPNLTAKFTKDLGVLAGGLAGIKAERGTALYDSLVFSLYYFNGIKGQRAILLLSDGKDENSKFSFEDALDYARRAGVTIYSIGLGKDLDKRKLTKLAEETGGRSFFVQKPEELSAIYSAIEQELRSQYLLAYQSTNSADDTEFRTIECKVGKPGLEAKTLRGYYP